MTTCIIDGLGLHTGEYCEVMMFANTENTGINFHKDSKQVSNKITSSELATSIGDDGLSISTIEHFMSLFYALGVHNIDIHVDGPEMPILDGSAISIYNKISDHDFLIKGSNGITHIKMIEKLMVGDDDAYIIVSPSDKFEISFHIDFDHPLIGKQDYNIIITPESYLKEIAPARTFGFYEDLDYLKESGFAKGASLENTIVLTKDDIMNPEGLRFPDEFVRHKILDLIGDFSLLDCPLDAKIEAYKSGHALNREMVEKIKGLCDTNYPHYFY